MITRNPLLPHMGVIPSCNVFIYLPQEERQTGENATIATSKMIIILMGGELRRMCIWHRPLWRRGPLRELGHALSEGMPSHLTVINFSHIYSLQPRINNFILATTLRVWMKVEWVRWVDTTLLLHCKIAKIFTTCHGVHICKTIYKHIMFYYLGWFHT